MRLLSRLLGAAPREPVLECGYAYPDHSASVHYHSGHPRKKRETAQPGTGPYDGDQRYANTGVPQNPDGETYADI